MPPLHYFRVLGLVGLALLRYLSVNQGLAVSKLRNGNNTVLKSETLIAP